LDGLEVTGVVPTHERAGHVEVTHRDGRQWLVEVRSEETGVERSESCGKALATLRRWTCVITPEPISVSYEL
jgi:hypothetical protein